MHHLSAIVSSGTLLISATPLRILVSVWTIAFVAGSAEFLILLALAYFGVSRLSMTVQSSVVTGFVTGGFAWTLLLMFSLRRRYMRKKLQVVRDLNYELRNALEVILQSSYLSCDERIPALLSSAVRIEKALAWIFVDKVETEANGRGQQAYERGV